MSKSQGRRGRAASPLPSRPQFTPEITPEQDAAIDGLSGILLRFNMGLFLSGKLWGTPPAQRTPAQEALVDEMLRILRENAQVWENVKQGRFS